jgi:hypothetical protein
LGIRGWEKSFWISSTTVTKERGGHVIWLG